MKKKYIKKMKEKIRNIDDKSLSKKEIKQLAKYLYLYKKHDFKKHWELNQHISKKKKWDKFKKIRSYNDHGYKRKIKGIHPKYFRIISKVLKINGGGHPLKQAFRY